MISRRQLKPKTIKKSLPTSYNFTSGCGGHILDMNLRAVTNSSLIFFVQVPSASFYKIYLPSYFSSNIHLEGGHFLSGPPQQISVARFQQKTPLAKPKHPFPQAPHFPDSCQGNITTQMDHSSSELLNLSSAFSSHALTFAPHTL